MIRGMENFAVISRSRLAVVSIPVVAIGGISGENVNELQHTGIHGVAVVSAVLGKPDILEAARTLRSQVEAITHVF